MSNIYVSLTQDLAKKNNPDMPNAVLNALKKVEEKDFDIFAGLENPFMNLDEKTLDNFIDIAKNNTVMFHFLAEKYQGTFAPKQIDKLIDCANKAMVSEILCKKGLSYQQMEKIIAKHESSDMNNFGRFYLIYNAEKINKKVFDYMFDERQKDMSRWHYAPYQCCGELNFLRNIVEESKTITDENKLVAICNNRYLSDDFRDKMFAKGTLIDRVSKPTEGMLRSIYSTAMQTIGDEEATKEEKSLAFRYLQKFIMEYPEDCIIDLIERNKYDDEYNRLLQLLLDNNKRLPKKVFEAFTKANTIQIQDKLLSKDYMYEGAYKYMRDAFSKVQAKKYFLKTIFTEYTMSDATLYDEFIKKHDNMNMLKAIIVASTTPESVLDKIKELDIPEINDFLKIATELRRMGGPCYLHDCESPILKFAHKTMGDGAKDLPKDFFESQISKTIFKQDRPLPKGDADNILRLFRDMLKDEKVSHKTKSNIINFMPYLKSYLTNMTELYESKIGFIDYSFYNKKFEFLPEVLYNYDEENYKRAYKEIEKLSRGTLKTLRKMILDDIVVYNGRISYEEMMCRIFKTAPVYNFINEKIKELDPHKEASIAKDDVSNDAR